MFSNSKCCKSLGLETLPGIKILFKITETSFLKVQIVYPVCLSPTFINISFYI